MRSGQLGLEGARLYVNLDAYRHVRDDDPDAAGITSSLNSM
jgi:hypothetical protein